MLTNGLNGGRQLWGAGGRRGRRRPTFAGVGELVAVGGYPGQLHEMSALAK